MPGTAVFVTSNIGIAPTVLLHHHKHSRGLHEKVILLSVRTVAVPFVPAAQRLEIRDLGAGFYQLLGHVGFMETPNVPKPSRQAGKAGLACDPAGASSFPGRETLLTTGPHCVWRRRKALFSFLSRNARSATAFFRIPPNRVLELGIQIEL